MLKAKIQKLKAIHNDKAAQDGTAVAVAKSKNTKIEGNSQHQSVCRIWISAVAKSKNTKIEGNSQLQSDFAKLLISCC